MRDLVVQKYGGSSLATRAKVMAVARKVLAAKSRGRSPVVVVSAQGKETDRLLARAQAFSSHPNQRELAALLATGEQQSSALLAIAISELGQKAISLTAAQAGINASGGYGDSRIQSIDTKNILKQVELDRIVVVAGFQGINTDGEITTLGRGGSDITAVALAAALGCPCEIFTDVAGIYSTDPSLVAGAKKLETLDWDDLSEMASLGAKVLNERAIELGKKYAVPIYIASTHSQEHGTHVLEVRKMEEDKITAVLVDDDILRISIDNVPADADSQQRLFELLNQHNVNLGLVQREWMENGGTRISFTCGSSCRQVLADLEKLLPYPVEIIQDESRISLLGTGVLNQARVTSCIFQSLAALDIGLRHLITSERSLSFFIGKGDRDRVVTRLAKEFSLQEGS